MEDLTRSGGADAHEALTEARRDGFRTGYLVALADFRYDAETRQLPEALRRLAARMAEPARAADEALAEHERDPFAA